jgi:hypothetical protein
MRFVIMGAGAIGGVVGQLVIQHAEGDDGVQVLVFRSADPDSPPPSVTSSARWLTGSPALPPRGHAVVKDRVNAISLAPVEDFRHDSDLFGQGARSPEFQSRTDAALKRGFQTRVAELDLGRLLGD